MLVCGGFVSKKRASLDYRLSTLTHLFQKAKPSNARRSERALKHSSLPKQ
jgi:hypothetical protein